jgi:GPH family glycoside/pentoside/hexuronide:cation symporter
MPRVSFSTKTAFGVGQVAEGVKNAAFNYFLLFYYNQVLGLSGTGAGLALFVATLFDAVTDPMAGSLSDRLRHRWGRRHPFMYASALPLGLSFALLFQPPEGLGQSGLFLWLTAFAVLVRGSMTLYHVPHMALGAELSEDYGERTTIVAFRTGFGLLGIAATVAAAWLYFFRATPAFESGQLDPAVYPAFGIAFGALMALTVLASAWGTHDRIPHLPQPAESQGRLDVRAFVRDYAGALANDSFRPFFIGIVVFFVMRGIQEVLSVHMSTYFWQLRPDQIAVLSLSAFPGFIVGVPFWTFVARYLDKRPSFLCGVATFSAMIVLPPLLKIAGLWPPHGSPFYLALLAIATGLASFGAAAGIVMAGSMMADVADEHELSSGRRQEGIFFGALAFAGKSTSGLGGLIAGVGLDRIGFPVGAEPGTVDPTTVTALGVFYGPGIAIIAIVALVFLSRYRIDRARHRAIMAALLRQRAVASE